MDVGNQAMYAVRKDEAYDESVGDRGKGSAWL